VDRIAAWGGARQRAWSEYYQYVHRYLRDVVRLDPDRAFSQRLRDQLAVWPKRPFHLVTAHAPSIRLLRALEARVERPAVARPRANREADPEWAEPENLIADIEALVERTLDEGPTTLAAVASRILPEVPEAVRYAVTGRVAEVVARRAYVGSERERPWTPVLEWLEVENWTLDRKGAS
jgi:chromosome partition protein MukF